MDQYSLLYYHSLLLSTEIYEPFQINYTLRINTDFRPSDILKPEVYILQLTLYGIIFENVVQYY